ncbi:MAG TPA: hypothetical protein DEP05_09405 [Betaproteobacteria bacterium]|nr:hypothetical protein [Betaproteobacteria bacterium]
MVSDSPGKITFSARARRVAFVQTLGDNRTIPVTEDVHWREAGFGEQEGPSLKNARLLIPNEWSGFAMIR